MIFVIPARGMKLMKMKNGGLEGGDFWANRGLEMEKKVIAT